MIAWYQSSTFGDSAMTSSSEKPQPEATNSTAAPGVVRQVWAKTKRVLELFFSMWFAFWDEILRLGFRL